MGILHQLTGSYISHPRPNLLSSNLSRGPTQYTHGHTTSHRYCLAQDGYDFVDLTNGADASFDLSCYDKTARRFINIQKSGGAYALSQCGRATGIILSGHASHGMRYLDSNYKRGQMGGLISIQRFPEDNFATGYCVCFGISPFETLESSPCLSLPRNREIGIYKRVPFLHPVPPKAKYLLAYPLLKAPVVVLAFNSMIPGLPRYLSVPSSSLSIVASKTAVWYYDKNEDAFRLLAGSVEEGVAGVQDGLRSQARFDFISDIVTTKDENYVYLSDQYGKSIRVISIASGLVSRFRTLQDTIFALCLSNREEFLVSLSGNGKINLHYVDDPEADASIQLTDVTFDQFTSIVISKGDSILYLTYNNAIAKVNIYDESTFQIVAGFNGISGNIDGVGVNARFASPSGITIDSNSQYLYVTDTGNSCIRRINVANMEVTTLRLDISGKTPINKISISIDGLYAHFCIQNSNNILRVNFVSKGIPEGYVESIMKDTNSSLETAQAKNTSDLLFDGISAFDITQDGNFFLYSSVNATDIFLLRLENMEVSQIHDYSGMITTTPSHIDTHENIFVVTLPHDNKICEGSFHGDLRVLKCIGGSMGFENGGVDEARFNGPSYVTFSGDGSYLLVSDEGNNCIRKIMRPPGSNQNILEDELSQVETIAGVCGPLSTPHIHKFERPRGLSIHPSGMYFLVVDSGNKQIKKVSLLESYPWNASNTPSISIFSGSGREGGLDGHRLASEYSNLYDIEIDYTGTFVLATDQDSCLIKKSTWAICGRKC